MSKHTPMSIKYFTTMPHYHIRDAEGNTIIKTNDSKLAQLIVTACNEHEVLKKQNEELVEALEKLQREIYIASEALARAREI